MVFQGVKSNIFDTCYFSLFVETKKLLKQPGTFAWYTGKVLYFIFVGSVVEWLKHRTDDQHGLGSKPTCAILLCPWERHFTALSPAWWS